MEDLKEMRDLIEEKMVLDVNGKKYSPRKLHLVADFNEPKPLNLYTLTGLVDYIKAGVDGFKPWEIFVQVVDPVLVKVLRPLDSATQNRFNLLSVTGDHAERFKFGTYLDSETFIVQVGTMFKETTDAQKLISFVSKISIENGIEVKDDGISQGVAIKKGMSGAMLEKKDAPLRVDLRPFRTFREVDQPLSTFLFRMKVGGPGNVPLCALFETDGGEWENEAIMNIRAWLKEKAPSELTILA